jgi:hypothetical protein
MNIPRHIYQYNDKKYIRELSDFIQESYDLSTMKKYLELYWSDAIIVFNNYKNIDNKILLAMFCLLYDNGGIFINNYANKHNFVKKVNEMDLMGYNYFFSLDENFTNIMGTFKNNPIYREMIEYMISIENDINYTSLWNIIYNYKNLNDIDTLQIGSSTNKTKEISLDKKYINPVVLFNKTNYSDNFDYMYHDNKLVIIRTDSVSDWSQELNISIYDDIQCSLFILN